MKYSMIAMLLIAALSLGGCTAQSQEDPIVYSNLEDSSIRMDLDSLMSSAGIPDRSRAVFFDHVDQMNEVLDEEQTAVSFRPLEQPLYDPYDLQDAWDLAHPDFVGYNCRITAYSLMEGNFLEHPEHPEVLSESMTVFDLGALAQDPSAVRDLEGFRAFYSTVPTKLVKDESYQAEVWLKSWQDRGIRILDNPKARMITVVFHMEEEEGSSLYVGHAGILLPTPDDTLWFLEKLSFQEPYQVVVFKDRQQLYDYLMNKYDLDENQPVAKPFILENQKLMEHK